MGKWAVREKKVIEIADLTYSIKSFQGNMISIPRSWYNHPVL